MNTITVLRKTQSPTTPKVSEFFTLKSGKSGLIRFLAGSLIAVSMLGGTNAQAAPIALQEPALSDTSAAIFLETTPGSNIVESKTINQTNLEAALSGIGNVELGSFGSDPTTTLTGHFGDPSNLVVLSSLVLADWIANDNALTKSYINDAASSIGATLTLTELNQAIEVFLDIANVFPTDPWQLVSDPNISDVNLVDGRVVVGLDGFLDAKPILDSLFGPIAPDESQASEVVKVTYQGKTEFLYGFSATPTGYTGPAGSFTGRFEVKTVPEPETLALISLGVVAFGMMRRRRPV